MEDHEFCVINAERKFGNNKPTREFRQLQIDQIWHMVYIMVYLLGKRT